MRRHVLWSLFAIGVSLGGSEIAAASAWGDVNGLLHPAISMVETPPLPYGCVTPDAPFVIQGIGEHLSCPVDSTGSAILYSLNGQRWLALREPITGMFFRVEGVCDDGLGCRYSQQGDVLLDRDYGSYSRIEARIYKQFRSQLTLRPGHTSLLSYVWTGSSRPASLQTVNGQPLSIGAIGMSDNGRWGIIELRDQGTMVVNVHTFEAKRVLAPGYRYGVGFDPIQQLAITNDGLTAVVTGENSGFNMVKVTPECGDQLVGPLQDTFSVLTVRCPTVGIYTKNLPPIKYYSAPSFNTFATHLVLWAGAYSGVQYKLLFSATGSLPPSIDYLAMGDSFSSGEGETDDVFYQANTNTNEERCHVSRRSYPYLLGIGQTRNVACSGARLSDVINTTDYAGQGRRLDDLVTRGISAMWLRTQAIVDYIPGRVAQAEFLSHVQPQLVTVSVGGNDAGILAKLSSCAMPGTCEWAQLERFQRTANEIRTLFDDFVALYRSLSAAAPLAQLMAIGYPVPVSQVLRCDPVTATLFSVDERRYMNRSIMYLNTVIAAAAHRAGIRFVDTERAFDGHRLCDRTITPAMNGVRLGDEVSIHDVLPSLVVVGSESFHPTPFGHELLAAAVKRRLANQSPICASVSEHCVVNRLPPESDTTIIAKSGVVQAAVRNRELALTVPDATFQDDAPLTVSLNLVPISRVSATRGGLIAQLKVPDSIPDGIATLHVEGLTAVGVTLDAYQVLRIGEPPVMRQLSDDVAPPVVRSVAEVRAPPTSQLSVAVLGVTARPVDTNKSSQPKTDPKQASDSAYAAEVIQVTALSVLIGVSIMAVWLLFAHLLKN